jgi:hypothetical protein
MGALAPNAEIDDRVGPSRAVFDAGDLERDGEPVFLNACARFRVCPKGRAFAPCGMGRLLCED